MGGREEKSEVSRNELEFESFPRRDEEGKDEKSATRVIIFKQMNHSSVWREPNEEGMRLSRRGIVDNRCYLHRDRDLYAMR